VNDFNEGKWKAESDARTLAESDVIRNDSTRHSKAQEAAVRLAKEAQEQADAMAKTAGNLYPNSKMPAKK
jgi:phage/plasmid primase-like uncharacterized protein